MTSAGDHNPNHEQRRPVQQNRRHLLCRRDVIGVALTGLLFAAPVSASSKATPVASPEPIDLAAAIDALLPVDGGVYGFVVEDPDGEVHFRHNPGVPFVAASLYKLPLMAHIFKLSEQGLFSRADVLVLDEWFWSEGTDSYYDHAMLGASVSIDELLFAMGAWSSNVAAWALATLVDWWDVQITVQEIGMTGTLMFAVTPELTIWPPAPGDDDSPDAMRSAASFIDAVYGWSPVMITTPGDIAVFFRALLNGTAISASASWEMLAILQRQAITDRFPALLPDGAELAHKTGNLSQVLHDAGIIYTPAGPRIVVGMCEAFVDEWGAWNALQQLALTVYSANLGPAEVS